MSDTTTDEDQTTDATDDPQALEAAQDEEELPQAQDDGADEPSAEAQDEPQEADADDGVTVTIGQDAAPAEDDFAPQDGKPLVPHLRSLLKEKDRQLRELKRAQAAAQQPAAPAIPELPPRPTLESVGFDEDAFVEAVDKWTEKKREHDAAKAKAADEQAAQQRAWTAKLQAYEEQKKTLGVPDYDAAEETARATLSLLQQSVLVKAAQNPAAIVYAIHRKHPKALELASMSDPVDFAAAIGRLEAQGVTVQKKSAAAAPPPERVLKGNIPGATAVVDSTLEKLRMEAERTGDFTKVRQYRDKMKMKQK